MRSEWLLPRGISVGAAMPAKSLPLWGRWQPAGLTDEVVLLITP